MDISLDLLGDLSLDVWGSGLAGPARLVTCHFERESGGGTFTGGRGRNLSPRVSHLPERDKTATGDLNNRDTLTTLRTRLSRQKVISDGVPRGGTLPPNYIWDFGPILGIQPIG